MDKHQQRSGDMIMRFATYTSGGQQYYGAVAEEGMISLNDDFPQWPTLFDAVEAGGLTDLGMASRGKAVTHRNFQYEMVLPNARRIICVGVNFPDRNAEYKDGSEQPKYMSLFPRFASGFTGHDRPLIRPPENHTLDYEGEVAIVIGKTGRRIDQRDAYDHILALTLCNEGTIRDWVRHAKFNVTQGKNWDKSGAMGPWLVPFTDPAQLDNARIVTRVNGEIRQDDVLARMMHPIRREIEYISTFMTLQPGDIIVTGTPTGSGARFDPPRYLEPGDVVEIEVKGIGTLRNTIEDEVL
jgi:2-keto-4-pentenoate hydratase/2-oxohepta-3-ene-1,7-dioic acid hydratase in catechol pathway